jgi:hypothetical protein
MTSLVQAHGPDRGGVVGALSSSAVRASSSLRATGTDWSAVLRSSDAAVPGPTDRRDGAPLRSHLEEAPNGIYAVVNQRRAWGVAWLPVLFAFHHPERFQFEVDVLVAGDVDDDLFDRSAGEGVGAGAGVVVGDR